MVEFTLGSGVELGVAAGFVPCTGLIELLEGSVLVMSLLKWVPGALQG